LNHSKHILVTGGAGFIGTHMCHLLAQQGHRITVIDLKTPARAVQGVEYIRGDVRDAALVAGTLMGCDYVYHFAATVSVPLCQKDPQESYSNNFYATVALLEVLKNVNTKRSAEGKEPVGLVFASTAAIYGSLGDDGRALAECEMPETFMSFYAAQKHASEQAIKMYTACFGIPSISFRFFNVYGYGQDPKSPYSGVITLFLDRARRGQDLPLNDGGYQTRDFVAVEDLVQACADVLLQPKDLWRGQVMNLGTGQSCTIAEVAQIISAEFGGRSKLVAAPARDGDVKHSKASIERAKVFVGYKPQVTLAQGLAKLIKSIE
jgi:UDP-glucose 4-epimerase